MPKENQIDPRTNFVPRRLPWVLGGVMLVVYWATLNPWVNLQNIQWVATVSGWNWRSQFQEPLSFLLTLPFRWLPVAHIPIALNLLSTICSAATLAVLARSVAILPHDRTEMERLRERSDFSFLSGWAAWAPPVAAVIFAGFQLTFWENATSFNGASFDLLWFAVILWQLLEYRMDEREGRLYLAAGLFGAGLIENWGLVGFIPVFLMMIIWLRGLSFFKLDFLIRLTWWGLIGMLVLLVLLIPLLARFSGAYPVGFGEAVKFILKNDWQVVKLMHVGEIRHDLALMSLTSLLPAFLMALRWSASFGDSSRMGATFVNYMMYGVHGLILGVLIWVTLDPPFSPRQLIPETGLHAPGLTFYYLAALCLGYYCGYFLLIFGQSSRRSRRNSNPRRALPKSLAWLGPLIVAGVVAALALGAGLLLYKNAPLIRSINGDSLLKFAQFAAQQLPQDGAIVLCDDDESGRPIRSYLLQAELARTGHTQKFPVVDTGSLEYTPYHNYLHQHFPQTWPPTVIPHDVLHLSSLQILGLLVQVSTNHHLCYLTPSFGYYFEKFYQEPHGLVYSLKPLPDDTLLPPPLDKNLIAENDAFWKQVLESTRPALEPALQPRNLAKHAGLIGQAMKRLHVPAESNPNADLARNNYSRSLNFLGVQLQRAGELEPAASWFSDAIALNSNNVVASINLAFNKNLRTGSTTVVNHVSPDQFGKYRDWNEVIAANGPFDEISFCSEYGAWLIRATPRLMLQALNQFNRVRQLAPDNLGARLFLAEIYLAYEKPDRALEALHDPLTRPFRFALTELNSTELNVDAATAYFLKHENATAAALLESEMNHHPEDETLMLKSAQIFNRAGLYTNALQAINRKLARTPDDLSWLYGKGLVSLQIGAYSEAVAAFSHLLELDTNFEDARFRRALAYYQSDQFEAARADFLQLQAAHTNNYHIAYGLGEIAWRQHQTNEAIRNYRVFLTNAPPNAAELNAVRDHLNHLGGQ